MAEQGRFGAGRPGGFIYPGARENSAMAFSPARRSSVPGKGSAYAPLLEMVIDESCGMK